LTRERRKEVGKEEGTSIFVLRTKRIFECWKRYGKILFYFTRDLKRRFGAKIIRLNQRGLSLSSVLTSDQACRIMNKLPMKFLLV